MKSKIHPPVLTPKGLTKKFGIAVFVLFALISKAQNICNASGNLMLFTNYDGGTLTINVDQNISNLKIGICSYEACYINFTGAFLSNVSEVRYAGYNNSNNTSCGSSIATTTINGLPGTVSTSVIFAPTATLSNSNGYGSIICGYSCSNNTSQGGCNTVDQIEAYFLGYFSGSSLYAHKVQYGCWTGTQSVSVGGNCCPPPPVYAGSVTASQTICAGQTPNPFSSSASASVSAGTIIYGWEASTTSSSSGFSPIASANAGTYAPGALTQTTYYRRGAGTSTNNIVYSNVITVNVLPLPLVSITGPTAVCYGLPATLSASGGTSYLWSPGGATTASALISPSVSIIVSVTCFAANGCSATVSKPLLVNPLPLITAGSSHPSSLCAGETATLTASGAITYTWQPGNMTGASVTVSPASTTVYTVMGSNQSGCVTLSAIILNVDPSPTISVINNPTLVCEGTANVLTASGAMNYTWTPINIFNASVSLVPAGITVYTVTGYDGSCTGTVTVVLNALPSPTVLAGSLKQTICKGESTFITVSGADSYTLQNSNTSIMSSSIAVSPTVTTNFTITGTGANGCSRSAVQTITVSKCTDLPIRVQDKALLKIYPNPNNGEFVVEGESNGMFDLITSAGQTLRHLELNDKNGRRVSVTGLSAGIYFIVNSDRSVRQKISVTGN